MEDSKRRNLSGKYESLDYDLIENVIYLEHQHKSRFNNFLNRDLQRWLAIFVIGFATALSGFVAAFAVNNLTRVKFSQIIYLADDGCPRSKDPTETLTNLQLISCMLTPYLAWIAWNIVPSLISSLLVTYISPVAAGSGIPVVKCYLNGVNIPEVVQFKTYIAKFVGVIASVIGGLAVGKEGPFIHCGAVLGAGLSQGKCSSFNFDLRLFKSFRNDRDKRDFVSAGASAGVSAAFGAPLGGVLFALEEGASFWNQALTWRIFFCSMTTSFILNLLMSAYNQSGGTLKFYDLVNFGLVDELDYNWFEIPIYICIAIFGGLIGASFCYTNLIVTRWRKKYVSRRWVKVLETVLVAIISATAGSLLILFASGCRKLPDKMINQNITHDIVPFALQHPRYTNSLHGPPFTYDSEKEIRKALSGHVLTFMCPPGEYSEMSSLWLKTSEGASSTFMFLQDDIWSIKTLGLFFVVYYLLAVTTYGLSISAGVFIPSLLIGATGGRIVGLILRYYFGPLEWLAQPNKFAIIGAASVLGGVVRMTISLTVILIEATGCISFGLPIMISLMVSKWVADSFIEGLYDLAIHLANVPFLGWEPPLRTYSLYASDVMSHNVKVLQTTETVANLINLLNSSTHNGFPVVDLCDDRYSCMETENLPCPLSNARQLGSSRHSSDSQTFDSCTSDTRNLVQEPIQQFNEDFLIGSFQRCSITAKRESYGRYRGLVLRWQLLVMLDLKIFNENERSFENLNYSSFQKSYPRYPTLEQVVSGLSKEMYDYHVDLRSIMNPTSYTVLFSASFPRIYQLFRSLGLRHLVVTDDRNQVVGMITRKDLARYVYERDNNGQFGIQEIEYVP